MLPAQPPLPTPWNFWFQPSMGSHSSMRMSESLDGVSVAATRQNAGRFCMALFAPGAVNDPPVTVCAAVIFVFGRLSDASFSQVAAVAVVVAGRAGWAQAR